MAIERVPATVTGSSLRIGLFFGVSLLHLFFYLHRAGSDGDGSRSGRFFLYLEAGTGTAAPRRLPALGARLAVVVEGPAAVLLDVLAPALEELALLRARPRRLRRRQLRPGTVALRPPKKTHQK